MRGAANKRRQTPTTPSKHRGKNANKREQTCYMDKHGQTQVNAYTHPSYCGFLDPPSRSTWKWLSIYLSIYIYAEDLIWWAIFRLQAIKKLRERRKTKTEKGRLENKEETWKYENPHLFGGGFSWPILTIKLGNFEIINQKPRTSWGLPHIYIYIFIYLFFKNCYLYSLSLFLYPLGACLLLLNNLSLHMSCCPSRPSLLSTQAFIFTTLPAISPSSQVPPARGLQQGRNATLVSKINTPEDSWI